MICTGNTHNSTYIQYTSPIETGYICVPISTMMQIFETLIVYG